MIAVLLLAACAGNDAEDPTTEPAPPPCEPEPLATGDLDADCNGTSATTVPLADARHLLVVGARALELGNAVACSGSPVGAFDRVLALGGWESNSKSGDYGALALLDGEAQGVIPASEVEYRVVGTDNKDRIGARVVFPGDVDGDGDGELLTTAITAYRPNPLEGAAFLYHAEVPGSFTPEDADTHFRGGDTWAQLGGAAVAGDLDGDGRAEILVSETRLGRGGFGETGEIRIYRGSSFGGTVLPLEAAAVYPAVDLASAAGWEMLVADVFGGDGMADLVTSEIDWGNSTGRVLVVAGPLLDGAPRTLDDASVVIEGNSEFSSLGASIATGDVNGDGTPDLVVAAHVTDAAAGERTGEAYVFFGPLAAGTHAARDADIVVTGESAHAWMGFGVAVVDHDGDGNGDLVVGAADDPHFPPDRPGLIYVFPGPLLGGALDPARDAAVIYEDDQHSADLGSSIAGCDLDGDGDDELVIGSPFATVAGEPASGRVHVVAGGPWRAPP